MSKNALEANQVRCLGEWYIELPLREKGKANIPIEYQTHGTIMAHKQQQKRYPHYLGRDQEPVYSYSRRYIRSNPVMNAASPTAPGIPLVSSTKKIIKTTRLALEVRERQPIVPDISRMIRNHRILPLKVLRTIAL